MFIAASTNEPIHVDSVSALNASRSAYDGREVVVRGYIDIGPEQLYLLDRRFDSDDAWTKASGCLSLLDVGDIGAEATRLNGKYVELSGTFVKDNLRHGASLMVCGETGVDLHSDPKRAIRVLGSTVAIATLNSTKAEYDQKVVTVRGYLSIGAESLYVMTRKGYVGDFWQPRSGCLSLLNTGDLGDRVTRLDGALVEITGTFQASNQSYGVSMAECGLTGLDVGGDLLKHVDRHPVRTTPTR